jgi:Na+/phosphate symporter
MVQILFPALVCVLGLVAYALSQNPKIGELGRIAFFCGLFFVVWALAGERLRF